MMSRQTVNFPSFFCRELGQFELGVSNKWNSICMYVPDVPMFFPSLPFFYRTVAQGTYFFQASPYLIFLFCVKDIA